MIVVLIYVLKWWAIFAALHLMEVHTVWRYYRKANKAALIESGMYRGRDGMSFSEFAFGRMRCMNFHLYGAKMQADYQEKMRELRGEST
jgi:hypothetical protein